MLKIFKDGFQIKEVHNSKGTIDAIDILEKIIAKFLLFLQRFTQLKIFF